ncbi:MAG: membrane protein [Rhodothalassiaceae bacterium]|nr:MAG: membrane protein [Rhodothalassiaceae bacterium]
MPTYLRKSIRAGPFRFNFSKSGLGVSVGVKGLRVGAAPKAYYVHAGRNGIYYRKTFSKKSLPNAQRIEQRLAEEVRGDDPSQWSMISITSETVRDLESSHVTDLLNEIRKKYNRASAVYPLALAGSLVALILWIAYRVDMAVSVLALSGFGALLGKWLDSFQKVVILYYDLDSTHGAVFENVRKAVRAFQSCGKLWHINAFGMVEDLNAWKRNAGATSLVDRKVAAAGFGLPNVVKSNIDFPRLVLHGKTLYFMPDFILLEEKSNIFAALYEETDVNITKDRFIEIEEVPSDAEIIGHTWRHPNKSGGPDRRFRDNYQVPICYYENVHLTSKNGLSEMVQCSRSGCGSILKEAIREMAATGLGKLTSGGTANC